MKSILALCGSLRAESSNRTLLLAARDLAPAGIRVTLWERIGDLPHFNPDLDGPGAALPEAVQALRDAVTQSAGVLISCPEYAHGIPGAFKNALDWLVSSPAMIDKPISLIYGSATDAPHARAALEEVLRTMSARVVASVGVPGVRTRTDTPQTRSEILSALNALTEV
jgi:NAD(P)H-dependent FMN reductase